MCVASSCDPSQRECFGFKVGTGSVLGSVSILCFCLFVLCVRVHVRACVRACVSACEPKVDEKRVNFFRRISPNVSRDSIEEPNP